MDKKKTYIWWGQHRYEVTRPMVSLMKRLYKHPCKAADVPTNLRVFSKLEDAGLAHYDNRDYPTVLWRLSPKGKNFMDEYYHDWLQSRGIDLVPDND